MGSINAGRVAAKVVETINKGQLVNLSDIIVQVGYSKAVATHPTSVTNTKSYKQVMALQGRPLLEGMAAEVNRIKLAIETRDLSQEDYKTLIGSLDVLVRNYQLLSGGATERQVFVLPSEVMERNAIERSKDGSTEPFSNVAQ